jgi:hypothetical protein
LCVHRTLAAAIFDKKTNLSDEEIRDLLNLRVSSKDMTAEQQIAAANKLIRRLKDTLSDFAKAKNDFMSQAMIAERNIKNGWANALEIAQLHAEEKTYFKRKLKQMEADNIFWKDNAKDTMRELSIPEDKLQNQQTEIDEVCHYKTRIRSLESQLSLCESQLSLCEAQLARAVADSEVSASVSSMLINTVLSCQS